jgi:hypothetical protein
MDALKRSVTSLEKYVDNLSESVQQTSTILKAYIVKVNRIEDSIGLRGGYKKMKKTRKHKTRKHNTRKHKK